MSIAGLGLIGAGAHAVFTTSTNSNQTITAGTPGAVEWSTSAAYPCNSLANATTYPTYCQSITLPLQTVGSTFDAPSLLNVTNIGNIALDVTSLGVAGTDGGAANYYLEQNLGLCVNIGGGPIYNALMVNYSGFDGTPFTLGTPIPLGIGDTYSSFGVDLYAGGSTTYCGAGTVPALPNDASGGTDTVTLTVGYTG
ncbi:MAG: hypothetical protein ABSB54_16870 [Acidimicrobiales bacterium]|jgi:hypothetical protein